MHTLLTEQMTRAIAESKTRDAAQRIIVDRPLWRFRLRYGARR
jgi:hypothetical protein